jgi:hypothetical protein
VYKVKLRAVEAEVGGSEGEMNIVMMLYDVLEIVMP